MVEITTRKVKQLIKLRLQEGHVDDIAAKWLSLQLILWVSLFSTHVQRFSPSTYIISGCDGPTEQISAFVDRLIQPVVRKEVSYLKDTTDRLLEFY